jgi:mono/diheme cytochrome c family protein
MAMAGVIAAFLTIFFIKRTDPFRSEALRAINLWILFWAPVTLAGGWWYATVVPDSMRENLGAAMLTMQFEGWQHQFYLIILGTAALLYLIAQVAVLRPRWVPRPAYLVSLLAIVWLTGHFERVREFIRKPYVMGQYMYANGIRVSDYPLLKRDGLLAHSAYTYSLTAAEAGPLKAADREQIQRGKDVFMIACSRCHTGVGVNSVLRLFRSLFGDAPWDREQLAAYTTAMHDTRPYMPPFPGTREELLALSDYLIHLRTVALAIPGAQHTGVAASPQGVPTKSARSNTAMEGRQ